jgi:hypothetical protein
MEMVSSLDIELKLSSRVLEIRNLESSHGHEEKELILSNGETILCSEVIDTTARSQKLASDVTCSLLDGVADVKVLPT